MPCRSLPPTSRCYGSAGGWGEARTRPWPPRASRRTRGVARAAPPRERAVSILESRNVDFEFDGDIQAGVALNYDLMQDVFPFCRLSSAANVLVMPALHSASISSNLLGSVGGATVIGPILVGLSKPIQVVPLGSSVNDLVNIAAFAAHDAIASDAQKGLPGV